MHEGDVQHGQFLQHLRVPDGIARRKSHRSSGWAEASQNTEFWDMSQSDPKDVQQVDLDDDEGCCMETADSWHSASINEERLLQQRLGELCRTSHQESEDGSMSPSPSQSLTVFWEISGQDSISMEEAGSHRKRTMSAAWLAGDAHLEDDALLQMMMSQRRASASSAERYEDARGEDQLPLHLLSQRRQTANGGILPRADALLETSAQSQATRLRRTSVQKETRRASTLAPIDEARQDCEAALAALEAARAPPHFPSPEAEGAERRLREFCSDPGPSACAEVTPQFKDPGRPRAKDEEGYLQYLVKIVFGCNCLDERR